MPPVATTGYLQVQSRTPDRETLLRDLQDKPQRAAFTLTRDAVDVEARTVELAWASEEPYERWWGVEILDMGKKSVRMQRLTNGAAVLLNHDRYQQIGVVESARLDADRKGRALVRFSRGQLGEEVLQDVADGIRTKVSVGYRIHDIVLEREKDGISTYRVTDWEPYELSIVSIPADDSVGVGRSADRYNGQEETMTEKSKETGAAPDVSGETVAQFNASNEKAARDAHQRVVALHSAIRELGKTFAEKGGEELAESAIRNPDMTLDSFRAALLKHVGSQMQPTQTGRLEADRGGDLGARANYGVGAREAIAAANLKAFQGIGQILGMKDHEVAYRAGRWCMGAIHGDGNSLRWCRDAGMQIQQGTLDAQRAMTEGVFTSAGWLVPVELEAAIIANREQYGVARRICNVIPMSSASTSFPRVTGDVTAYFVGEGSPGTESDPAGDQVTLTLKDLMAFTKIGKSTAQDTVIALAEMVAREQARAFAMKEDACLILGDGTSTYGGILGLKTLLDDAAYAGGRVQAASGHDTFPEIDISDAVGLIGILPVYARPGARWIVSGVFDALVFGRLKLNAGGNDIQSVQGAIVEQSYAGFPITVAHHMPAGAGTTYNGVTIAILANTNLGVAFGSGSGMMMVVDPFTLADRNLTRIITSERIDINCHGVNKSTTVAGPIVGLHGRT